MSEQDALKKEKMIEAINKADQVYLLTQCGNENTSGQIEFGSRDTASTISFIVVNFITSSSLLIDADQALSIASNGELSALPADLVKDIQLISTRVKLHFSNEQPTEADDE